MDYLFSLGHQRIGYVGECHNETRYQGYLESFQKHNLNIEPAYVIETKQTEIAGFEVKNGHSSVVRMELEGKLSQVMNTISLFEQFHVEYNILTVVTNETAQKASALYHFYKRNKMAYIQLIPCMDEINRNNEVNINSQAVKPEQYGKFLNEMFDLWYEDFMHGEDMDIRMFSNLAQLSAGFHAEESGRLTIKCLECSL